MALEKTRQQRTPANFGVSATNLSDISLASANFVKQGVVDNSSLADLDTATNIVRGAGQAAEVGIEIGKQVHEGFQLADLESKLEDNIQSFVESRNNPQIADQAALDASTLSQLSEGLWARLGDGASIEDVDAIEGQYQATMQKYEKAVKQGVMSTEEFMTNSLAITRQAINRNPALYDSILQHGKKVMGLSGVESIMKAEEASAKAQAKIMEDRMDSNRSFLFQNNIMPRYNRDGSYDFDTNEAVAQQIATENQAAEMIARQGKIRNETEAARAADFMNKFGVQGVNGLINSVNKNVTAMLSDPNNKGDVLPIARVAFSQLLQQINERAGPVMHREGVKDTLSYAEKTIQSKLDILEKVTNREDLANWLKTEEEIQRMTEMVNLRKMLPLEGMKLLNQTIQSIGGSTLLANNKDLFVATTKTLSNLQQGVQNALDSNYMAVDGTGKNAVSSSIKQLATLLKNGQVSAQDGLDKMIDTIYADTRTNGKFKSAEERFAFYDTYIPALSAEGIEKIGDTQRAKASENLEDYMRITMSGFNKDIASLQDRGVEVKMGTLPDGRINISTSVPTETDNLIRKYQIRINNSLKAFAGLSGGKTSQVADEFYNQYEPIKGLSKMALPKVEGEPDGKPNATNPLNLTIPGKQGQFQRFPTTDDGIRAASAQLDRYFQGKTTGKQLQTVSQIVGTWNNENEVGSMSKKDYVSTVTKFSGLKSNEKLDLTDPYVKADLMFGMARAEGRGLRYSQILSALGLK